MMMMPDIRHDVQRNIVMRRARAENMSNIPRIPPALRENVLKDPG